MADNDGLIAAYILDGKGGGQRVGWKEIQEWTPTAGVLWVHLDFSASEAQR
jgi:zinc transporter